MHACMHLPLHACMYYPMHDLMFPLPQVTVAVQTSARDLMVTGADVLVRGNGRVLDVNRAMQGLTGSADLAHFAKRLLASLLLLLSGATHTLWHCPSHTHSLTHTPLTGCGDITGGRGVVLGIALTRAGDPLYTHTLSTHTHTRAHTHTHTRTRTHTHTHTPQSISCLTSCHWPLLRAVVDLVSISPSPVSRNWRRWYKRYWQSPKRNSGGL